VGSCHSKSHCSLAGVARSPISPVLSRFQGSCKATAGQNGSEQRTYIQNGGRDASFYPAFSQSPLGHLQTQVKCLCFSAKVASKYLLQMQDGKSQNLQC
jgi:hypothetical protein